MPFCPTYSFAEHLRTQLPRPSAQNGPAKMRKRLFEVGRADGDRFQREPNALAATHDQSRRSYLPRNLGLTIPPGDERVSPW